MSDVDSETGLRGLFGGRFLMNSALWDLKGSKVVRVHKSSLCMEQLERCLLIIFSSSHLRRVLLCKGELKNFNLSSNRQVTVLAVPGGYCTSAPKSYLHKFPSEN